MPSAINASEPVDGVPADKADLRGNLAVTKAELEHGGFFTQKGQVGAGRDTGQLERTSEARLNDLSVSVKDYGAIGDETSRPVSQWLTGGAQARGYADLAAIQIDYPHVTSLTDEIDWAAIQKALEVGRVAGNKPGLRVTIPAGTYYLNKTAKINFNVQVVGEGLTSTYLHWTSAHTSGPCMQIKPTPDAATSNGCQISDLYIDATAVPATNITNHGIETFNAVTPEIRRVYIMQAKGCGILLGQTFFATVESTTIDRCYDTSICLRSLQVNNTDGYGDGGYCNNGNHFTDIFLQCNYRTAPNTVLRPRLIEVYGPCEGNYFTNVQVQTGTYRLDDCWIYISGFSNVLRNFYAYDGPGAGRTFTTSSGAGGVVRITFPFMPNLVTGNRITATGVTGITSGTLYTLTSVVDEFVFDVAGTTYSGSPQTGRMVRGDNITATAAGNENRITCTCAGHNLYTGQTIVVVGITNGTGTQSVIRMDRNTFQLANTTFGGSTQTGTWTIDRPTTVIQFGDTGAPGANGFKNVVENCRVVADHDDNAGVTFCNFIGGAVDNRINNIINDQGGEIRPYLVENGEGQQFFTNWVLPNLPLAGGTRLRQFTAGAINYSPQLMCKDFVTNPPGLSEMYEGQLAFSVVGGVGKIYYKVGSAIHVFTSGTGSGQAPITTG